MARKKETMPATAPEWSHLVDVTNLEKPRTVQIKADEATRVALAKRLGVLKVEKAEADFELSRESGAVVHVSGFLKATVVQNCVVSLQPLQIPIDEEFEAWFADPEQAVSFIKARHEKIHKQGAVEMPILEENEDPEAIIDGKIDVGELTTQYFCLAIDPYPHAEGVQYEVGDDTPPADIPEERKNPFAALKDWKNRYNKGEGQ